MNALPAAAACCAALCCPAQTHDTLANGLRVTLHDTGSGDRVAVVVVFGLGELHDPAGASGLAHLVEHCYVTAAAGDREATDVRGYLARYPLGWNAQTGDDYTVIAAVVKPEAVLDELHEQAARMASLAVAPADLERELPRMRLELANMYDDVPALAARNRARARVLPPPAGARKGGVVAHLERLDAAAVQARVDACYHPGTAHLAVVGPFDLARVRTGVAAAFGALDAGAAPPARRARSPGAAGGIEVVRAPAGAPGAAALGFRAPRPSEPDHPAFLVWMARLTLAAVRDRGEPGRPMAAWTPLDDPEFACVTRGLVDGDGTPEEVVADLRATLARWAARDRLRPDAAARVAINTFGAMLGLPGPGTAMMAVNNPYGAAFGYARRAQLGIDPDALRAAIEAVTAAELDRCWKRVFAAEVAAAVVVAPQDPPR